MFEAVAEVYAANMRRLPQLLQRRLGIQAADAEDFMQEAWLRVLQWKEQGVCPPEKMVGAVAKKARWLCWDEWRRGKEASLEELTPAQHPTYAPHTRIDAMVDVEQLMWPLSPRQEQAVQLCVGEGLTMGEAAAIMGVSKGTVQSLVERGMARLCQEARRG